MLLRFFLQQKQWARLLRVDGSAHFAAARAEEAEIAFAHFGRRPVAAEGGDRDGHGQVVTQAA